MHNIINTDSDIRELMQSSSETEKSDALDRHNRLQESESHNCDETPTNGSHDSTSPNVLTDPDEENGAETKTPKKSQSISINEILDASIHDASPK